MHKIKSRQIDGYRISFSDATVDDAEFILSLRTDDQKSKFLSKTESDVIKQQQWLASYATDSSQAYFIINDNSGVNIGTVRLYDIQEKSFCWGSWILAHNAPVYASIESALIIYAYALSLGFEQAHFSVRKENISVYRFHERFGAIKTDETADDYLYKIDEQAIRTSMKKYSRYLPEGIVVHSY